MCKSLRSAAEALILNKATATQSPSVSSASLLEQNFSVSILRLP
jgi:hypothetical protein